MQFDAADIDSGIYKLLSIAFSEEVVARLLNLNDKIVNDKFTLFPLKVIRMPGVSCLYLIGLTLVDISSRAN
jgi:hypothetical protein